jgi:Flp pilus assembly protein TadB
MAIDGRQLVSPPPEKRKRDAYDTTGLKVAASLMVIVPLAAIVAFAYWSGTWLGGTLGGVLGVVSTVATVAVLWVFRRRRT